METRYQRIAREQAERQAARAKRMADAGKAARKAARQERKFAKLAKRDRAASDWLVSDHNHDMDG